MARRWFQIRLSTLLVLVALTAVGADYWRQRKTHLEKAMEHERLAREYHDRWYGSSMTEPIQYFGNLALHHQTLAEKYEQAAQIPWLPVEPDPPEPKRTPLSGNDERGSLRHYSNIFETDTLKPGSSSNVNTSSP